MNTNKYIEKILNLKKEDLKDEIKELCNEANIDSKYIIMFLETSGINYTLDTLSSEIIYSGRKINKDTRLKISIFNIIERNFNSIFYLNTEIAKESNNWYRSRHENTKKEGIEKIKPKIENLLERFKTL